MLISCKEKLIDIRLQDTDMIKFICLSVCLSAPNLLSVSIIIIIIIVSPVVLTV